MGGRLSVPKGPAGTTESSVPASPGPPPSPKQPFPRTINSRTIVAPAAALTMACLLFLYTGTSIRAAKDNARKHQEADSGGEGLSLVEENRRRHGLSERLESDRGGTFKQLGRTLKKQVVGDEKPSEVSTDAPRASEEDKTMKTLRDAMERRGG
ncbi:hypothetical protein K431DRAFT_287864 [Polychaeton citri CBS 116435]|uniref:Transmembrane protein n=1 Tax=Polychaeton citri CBS 116435 TaxID=1314669 RepID=A0A9P4ULW4_9PEZI|nr:hypothetical protein K431DRAFT_287864 [Polychaeton citri CBS 116435]